MLKSAHITNVPWVIVLCCLSVTQIASGTNDVKQADDLEPSVAECKNQIHNLEQRVRDLETALSVLKTERSVAESKNQYFASEDRIDRLEKHSHNLEKQVKDFEDALSLLQTERSVAESSAGFMSFYVRRTSNWGPLTVRSPIEYDVVNMNIGGGWDSDAYMFTAKVAGVYHFDYAHEDGTVFFTVNGSAYQEVLVTSGSRITGSSSATIQLLAGDQVRTELYGDNSAFIHCQTSGTECNFSGFLLYEII